MKTILYILLFALAVLLYFNGKAYWRHFFPKKETYGVKFNGQRNKRGIMMVPRSWKSADSSASKQTWLAADTLFGHDTAIRKRKSIYLDHDKIIYEEDEIQRLLKDSAFRESLTLTYYYDSLSPWKVYYHKTGAPVRIRKAEADSILGAWLVAQYIE